MFLSFFTLSESVSCPVSLSFVLLLLSCITSGAQTKDYQLNEIIITASKSPMTISDITRDVVVINEDEIKSLPVNSVQDLLQYTGGVDLRQRGINGVQSDVGIRGGNFEETLILIDGIKVSDPQTGHHNLNLPLVLDNIQRIEILKGQGSRIFGPNAFSGVVNFITKKGNNNSFFIQTLGGQNNFFEGTIGGSYSLGYMNNYISFSKSKTNGYRHNTSFDRIDLSYNSSIKSGGGRINLFLGYVDNKFGANGFYSVKYPNQWEHTTTKFLNLSSEFGNEIFSFSPKIYWRRNDDNYLLDYVHPEIYQNIHQTNVYGAELQSSVNSGFGVTSFGGEYVNDEIKSTNLGIHSRFKKGIYAEQKISAVKNLNIIVGAFLYNYSDLGWRFWPGLDLGYSLSDNFRIYSSIGKAFRVPTYTELYYLSPVSKGNEHLKPEETLNIEGGINFTDNKYTAKISLYRKEGRNLIDWVRTTTEEPWTAKNISRINTNGFEINLSIITSLLINDFPLSKFEADYTYLNSDRKNESFESEYLLDFLRSQLIVDLENYWWLGIRQSWLFRYEDRINFSDHFTVDSKISKELGDFNIFIKATNLLNKSFEQVSGVPLPGRWIIIGIKFKISSD